MNVKEAMEIADNCLSDENKKKIKEIEKLIEEGAHKGEISCYYYKDLSDTVQQYFKRKGFLIKYADEGRNDFSYEFKW